MTTSRRDKKWGIARGTYLLVPFHRNHFIPKKAKMTAYSPVANKATDVCVVQELGFIPADRIVLTVPKGDQCTACCTCSPNCPNSPKRPRTIKPIYTNRVVELTVSAFFTRPTIIWPRLRYKAPPSRAVTNVIAYPAGDKVMRSY